MSLIENITKGSVLFRDRLIARVFPHVNAHVEFEAATVDFVAFRGDYIAGCLQRGHFYEEELLAFLSRRYGTGGIYVDVGAFIGNHTVFFASVCRAERVFAFEPNVAAYELLCRNIERNRLTRVSHRLCAVGLQPGTCRVNIADAHNLGTACVAMDSSGVVPVVTLDELVIDSPKLIKIDTEGMGMQVLEGARRTLEQHHPVVVVEVYPESIKSFEAYLNPLGYTLIAEYNATPTFVFE